MDCAALVEVCVLSEPNAPIIEVFFGSITQEITVLCFNCFFKVT